MTSFGFHTRYDDKYLDIMIPNGIKTGCSKCEQIKECIRIEYEERGVWFLCYDCLLKLLLSVPTTADKLHSRHLIFKGEEKC